ncbi:MAG TPA: hypothetical protein VJ698_02800 [Noviherbaspirillum sp.]|uniref:hypothetical protein n=1 Tax=Noviherbaspirillum sp. TaxID=1926288 RepID=UPI002B4677CA|nr:hypothetical protein [Noviherbaspirillum sp.]HJV84378.1 hypothetical protein [Noviherbaspirillum sp.]
MISLESKLAFLRQPSSYPDPVYRVEAIETHMSWVFLTDDHAYKLKKPVHYGPLDFRKLEARRFFCEEEVRLNRRLAPDVYLAAVPLVIDAQHHLALGGEGDAIDWLVKMRRLPAHRMLDYMIKANVAQESDMQRIAALLARFYRSCEPVRSGPDEYRRRFERDIAQNEEILCTPAFHLPARRIESHCNLQRTWLERISDLLDARVHDGRVVEGHGDLRAEHVCLENGLAIIDCLEFSRELRMVDTFDELAFLALECERLDKPEYGARLLRTYTELSGDAPDPSVIHFYQSVRACLRARIAISHLLEEQFRYSAEWPRRAMEYLQLAEAHAEAAHARLV